MQKTSLIEFSVENWGPFKERATLSMSARKKDGQTFSTNDENLLKTSLIYGPNASGKSSILDALYEFKKALASSANVKSDSGGSEGKLPFRPFLGSKKYASHPTFLEAVFSLEGTDVDGIYKYNFSVLRDKIVGENLVALTSSGGERVMLSRTRADLQTDKNFSEMSDFLKKQGDLRDDALMLSVFAQLNHKFAVSIVNGFTKKVNVITAVSALSMGHGVYTLEKFKENREFRQKILNYLRKADFCINNGEVRKVEPQNTPEKLKQLLDIFFAHPVFGDKAEEVGSFEIPLSSESDGTRNFFFILGPVIDTLEKGKIIFIDELDNSLHPLLTKFIVELFESGDVNVKNAQLVATTHDVSLLANKNLIKDQFWFTEKDSQGSAKLFSLAEFANTGLRNDTEYAKKYLEGRFGALPIIG